ncbi:hypothetical protein MTR_6g033905 [Medicago truncatula]|uniref:Uncharacterized protein n=1 Tax=Medicago truncatula TaxID=3880 RepID=A0A072U7R4_MEDTR|nr:hypothetical protein MTR_6g033905 [Medicago truncatula]
MASSSSVPESSSNMQQPEAPAYEIKGRTMSLEEWDLKIQTENPVDFKSLAFHGCNISKYYETQGLVEYFKFLNGPTYQTLVRHFWVRATIYDRAAAKIEEDEKTELRSSIMGIPIHISEQVLAYVLRRPAHGSFEGGIQNAKDSHWNENANLLPKGGSSDQPSLEHKIFLHFFIKREYANVPKYMFKHLVNQTRESQLNNRCWVPYGRLLSEIFHQGGILKALSSVNAFTDAQLGTETGKIINGTTLRHMKLIGKDDYTKLSTDMQESDAKSALMEDFPPICKQDALEVQMHFIRDHFERTNVKISLREVPEEMYGGPLPVAKSRKTKRKALTKEDYLEEASKKSSKKSKRRKVESVSQTTSEGLKKAKPTVIVSPMVEVTSEMEQEANELAEKELASQKQLAEQYRRERDEKLKAAGLLEINPLSAKKASEIVALAAETQEQTIKEATIVLQEAVPRGEGTSEAHASEFEATLSDSLKGIPDSPHCVDIVNVESDSTPSVSSDSTSLSSFDLDEITLSQKYNMHPKNHSPSSKTHKEPESSILEQINELASQRMKVTEHLSPNSQTSFCSFTRNQHITTKSL